MTKKIDWSKLSEMPPYAPTKEGWYQLANGIIGYLKGPDEASDWRISLNPGNAIFFRKTGEIITKNILGDESGWRIAKYLGDVLPWEECDQLEGLLVHANKEYASLLEACEADRQARLKLVEECERLKRDEELYSQIIKRKDAKNVILTASRHQYESELRAAEELNRKWRLNIDSMRDDYKQQIKQLEAERDEWKSKYKKSVDSVSDYVVHEIIGRMVDLQERVAKLEEFHEAIVKPGTGFTVVTLPQEIEPLPEVTEKTPAERAAFFAANPTLHPAYKPEHGDMAGWRYLEEGEEIKDGDEFLDARSKWHLTYDTCNRQGNPVSFPRRRRVQAEKEVV